VSVNVTVLAQANPFEWLWLLPIVAILCVVAYGVDRIKRP
jgi:hypothetical protein